MQQSLPISEIIQSRISRRNYLPEPLTHETITAIKQMFAAFSSGPLGTSLSFSLVSREDTATQKLKLGTYGFIQGARYFIAGQIQPSVIGFLDYGYTLEKLILEFTRMGLGTCWLGGTFDRGEFSKAIGLKEGFVIPAITPIGYASETRGIGERLIRLGAGSDKRLPHEKLFFDGNPSTPLLLPEGHPLESILKAVRMAPSASNNQPWRIVVDGNLLRFYISRKPGYQKAFSHVDMQMIDMGIAMSHFDLVARENGISPEWSISETTPMFEGLEYVISVFLPS
jgi:nitroreductase